MHGERRRGRQRDAKREIKIVREINSQRERERVRDNRRRETEIEKAERQSLRYT